MNNNIKKLMNNEDILDNLYNDSLDFGNSLKNIIGIREGNTISSLYQNFYKNLNTYLSYRDSLYLVKSHKSVDDISKFLGNILSIDIKYVQSIHRKFYSIYRLYLENIENDNTILIDKYNNLLINTYNKYLNNLIRKN